MIKVISGSPGSPLGLILWIGSLSTKLRISSSDKLKILDKSLRLQHEHDHPIAWQNLWYQIMFLVSIITISIIRGANPVYVILKITVLSISSFLGVSIGKLSVTIIIEISIFRLGRKWWHLQCF
jgi:hypothetical protein